MGEVTKEQREHITKGFRRLESTLKTIYCAIDTPAKVKALTWDDYERLNEVLGCLLGRANELARYINEQNSDEPPFNLFKGDLNFARHIFKTTTIINIRSFLFNTISDRLKKDGSRIENPPKLNKKTHAQTLSMINCDRNMFSAFEKISAKSFKPETFRLREVLDRVIADRKFLRHHTKFKFEKKILDLRILFDCNAIYWIVMRMLSNAEHATEFVENAHICIETFAKDGSCYLIVRDNGMGIQARARESEVTGGGKSKPNIEKMCEMLDSDFELLEEFPKGTIACLRLPLAESKK